MADPAKELLLNTLQACAGPEPLYPVSYSESAGVDRAVLDAALDRLRLAGLIRLTEWVKGKGQGYTVTPEGAMALERPGLIARAPATAARTATQPADHADGATTWQRGEAVRSTLISPVQPVVTLTLIALNVLVFVTGFAFAWHAGFGNQYLSGDDLRAAAQARAVELHEYGILTGESFLKEHQLWRILTYSFLHFGFFHILLNMIALYNLGPIMETMWGHWRFLYLYLVSAFTGGCAILFMQNPHGGPSVAPVAGASGAICGLLASIGAWLILNRHHLPQELTSRWLNQVFFNVILLALMSTIPHVSWLGHLGGFLGGAALSWPLNAQRFGSSRERFFGWVGLAAVPIAALGIALVLSG